MTREEREQAIADMRKLKAEYMNGRKLDSIAERKCKSFDMAIKTLEEPILDKIRAEIADLDDADYDYEGYYKAVTDALQVIDKYRQEG